MTAILLTRFWEVIQAIAAWSRARDAAIHLHAEQQAAKWRARIGS